MGLAIKNKLLAALSQWKNVFMVTLTYDPKLFPEGEEGQEAAYRYIRENRCVSRFMRTLRTRLTVSRHYFCVTEFQKSGNVHFHLLIDAAFIDWQTMVDIWGSFRPACAGPVEGDRPAFGTVDFRVKRKMSPAHAANYAAKYLTKPPESGWPSWVLNYRGRIPRFSTSRQFWKDHGLAPPRSDKQNGDGCQVEPLESDSGFPCDVTCFCEVCRGEGESETLELSSIDERLRTCGVDASVLRITETMQPDGVIRRSVCHLGTVKGGWTAALQWCDLIDLPQVADDPDAADLEFAILKHHARVPKRLAYAAAGAMEDDAGKFREEVSRDDLCDWLGVCHAESF